MLEGSGKLAAQPAEVCRGKGDPSLLTYPAPCSSSGCVTGTGLGLLRGFSPGCVRFCVRGRRGQSWLAQDGMSTWERPICPGGAKRGTWETCLGNSVLNGEVDLLAMCQQRASWRSLESPLGSTAGKKADGQSVRSWGTRVCLHLGSKSQTISEEILVPRSLVFPTPPLTASA